MKKKIILIVVILILAGGFWWWKNKNTSSVTYQTATAEKGTLVKAISGSGTITSGSYTNISTRASGEVMEVFVTNGDTVVKGQKIAKVILDEYGKEREAAAYADYLRAQEEVKQALADKTQADITMWNARQEVLDAQERLNNNTGNNETERQVIIKSLDLKRQSFTVAESKYLNANAYIAEARAQMTASYRDYLENSGVIVAPASGVISDLSLAEGLTVVANSTTSNTTGSTIVSAQTVGKVNNSSGKLLATVNLSEIDVLKVKANQKVLLTLDAYEDISFTGKVLSVNTTGVSSSGVTNYPVLVILDPATVPIFANMAVSAQIITDVKTDVVLVPSTAVTTTNGQATVQVKNGSEIKTVEVTTGQSNDSQIEIVSGVSEGETVVTAIINSSQSQTSTSTSSPFSGVGGNRSFIRGPGF